MSIKSPAAQLIHSLHKQSGHPSFHQCVGPVNTSQLVEEGVPVFSGRHPEHHLPMGAVQVECQDAEGQMQHYTSGAQNAVQAAQREEELAQQRQIEREEQIRSFQSRVKSWTKRKIVVQKEEGFKRGKVDKKAVPDYSKMYMQSIKKKTNAADKENEKKQESEIKSAKKEVVKEVGKPMLQKHKTLAERLEEDRPAYETKRTLSLQSKPTRPNLQLRRKLHKEEEQLKRRESEPAAYNFFVEKHDLTRLGIEVQDKSHDSLTLKQLEQFSLLQRLRRKEGIPVASMKIVPKEEAGHLGRRGVNQSLAKSKAVSEKQRFNSALMNIVRDKCGRRNMSATWLPGGGGNFPVNSPFHQNPKQYSKFLGDIMSCLNQFE